MNSVSSILIDTNVLIYATDSSSYYHNVAVEFVIENYNSLVLANQVVNEYIRVVTHKSFKKPLSLSVALQNIDAYKKSFKDFILPNSRTHDIFFGLLKKHKLVSNKIFDAYLVSIGLSNGVGKIATFNEKDYKAFGGIQIVKLF